MVKESSKNPPNSDITDYRYSDKRKNNPPAGLAAQGKPPTLAETTYPYDPHLPPVLRFAPDGGPDQLITLLEKARTRPLTAEEIARLTKALEQQQPWLEWAGKREKLAFEVDPVALHIHERISAQAILKLAQREPVQRSLFADPELDYRQAVQFYRHNVDWANRLILGDSLVVMNSLAKREDLAGKVQMIYLDPPYGIKFASNFQPTVGKRDVKDREEDLTREPEQIKAYRDTWTLGVHSYLAYLRDRLIVARELLTDSGSIFVQISDENVHRVRLILDEVFGPENFCALIPFVTTSSQTSDLLPSTCDFLLWYTKNRETIKYHQLYSDKVVGETGGTKYKSVELANGERCSLQDTLKGYGGKVPEDARIYRPSPLVSQSGGDNSKFPVNFQGVDAIPRTGFWKTNADGFSRLIGSNRIMQEGVSLAYIRYLNDFPAFPFSSTWFDTWGVQSRSDPKVYVVQTDTKVIERCMLMTTDPGDLILDPTCGSGTTAYVAEQWGRRWITIDTSRVAVALARQRLLTARFDYYELAEENKGVASGFKYKTVPHITLKSIAQNPALDPIFARWEPRLTEKLTALNLALTKVSQPLRTQLQTKLATKERREGKSSLTEADRRRWLLPKTAWQAWEVPFESDPEWPSDLQQTLQEYRKVWRQKMEEVNGTIAASAPQETLVDQPRLKSNVLRVSGPFTVEGVEPGEESLDLDAPVPSPTGELPTFPEAGDATAPLNAGAYLEKMVQLLRQDGVRFPNNKIQTFDRLEPLNHPALHAEGEWSNAGEIRRVAVSFGPQYGPVTVRQVEDGLRSANRRGYDELIFAGFSFDAAAQGAIQDDLNPRVRCHLTHIRPDVNMDGLLKNSPNSQLFTVFGLPRAKLERDSSGDYSVTMEGVDIYDPVNNTIHATNADKVAAWFLDSDYDGATFCVTQAFFPDSTAWEKLARALKTVIDPERFAAFSGTQSLPFSSGPHRRVAVKVIDPRGNEVMTVLNLA